MNKLAVLVILLALSISACTSIFSGSDTFTPIAMTAVAGTVIPDGGGTEPPVAATELPTMIPTLAGGLSLTELKYRLLEDFPDFFFCDPDFYPVARQDELTLANQRFPELQADQEEFQTILEHTGLSGVDTFSDEQKLLIYREYKKLNAITFQLVEDRYQFKIQTGQEGQPGTGITGTIDGSGSIEILQREPGIPTCPICLAAGTLIDTPRGAVRVEELQVGDPVWTQDEAGRRVPGTILMVGSMNIPASHQMTHVTLSDGRELWASAGHPTADRQRLGELRIGNSLDGARVVQMEHVPYDELYTFDILPSGTTGFYWANEILMGSTLAKP